MGLACETLHEWLIFIKHGKGRGNIPYMDPPYIDHILDMGHHGTFYPKNSLLLTVVKQPCPGSSSRDTFTQWASSLELPGGEGVFFNVFFFGLECQNHHLQQSIIEFGDSPDFHLPKCWGNEADTPAIGVLLMMMNAIKGKRLLGLWKRITSGTQHTLERNCAFFCTT